MKKISVEIPVETFEWLEESAKGEHRSVSGQIRFFLDLMRQTKADENGASEDHQ